MDLAVDWRSPPDFDEMRRFRLERTRTAMETYDLDAIVGFEFANARYITGLRPLWTPNFLCRQAGLVTRSSDDVIVFVNQDDTPHRRQTMSWLPGTAVREFPVGGVNLGDATHGLQPIRAALVELGFERGRLGVDVATPAVLHGLQTLFPESEVVDANPAMNAARIVKHRVEIDIMRGASAIVDMAMSVAIATAQPGVRECEVLAEAMRIFYRHGAEIPQCNLIVCSGPNTVPMQRFAGDRMIRNGDIVFIDIGACFNGMFSEESRTVIVGEPNREQRAIYRTVKNILDAAIGAIRPGVSSDVIRAAIAAPYAESPYHGTMQRMVIGHGIGAAAVEAPFITPPGGKPDQLVLSEGMTVAVVPTLQVAGVAGGGGIRLEDVVVVTSDGVEVMTRAPYDDRLLS